MPGLGSFPAAPQEQDPYADYPVVAAQDRSRWDKRADGTDKGDGWLGLRQRPDGNVSSEISVGIEMAGHEVELPLMVPGLTRDEMRWLMTTPTDKMKHIPPSILDKAISFAEHRLSAGKSPFRQADEPAAVQNGGR